MSQLLTFLISFTFELSHALLAILTSASFIATTAFPIKLNSLINTFFHVHHWFGFCVHSYNLLLLHLMLYPSRESIETEIALTTIAWDKLFLTHPAFSVCRPTPFQ